jgi:hypothetical protein
MSGSELITLNVIVHNRLQKASTPPFLGLLPLEDKYFDQARTAVKSFLSGDPHLLKPLFSKFGYVAGWVVARSLHETYGSEDRAVYSHLEDTLDVKLAVNGVGRTLLFDGFRTVCRKLGMPTENISGMVGLYLLQAGVAEADLEHLVEALFHQERAFGSVSRENTATVNSWEDDAMAFMPAGLVRPKTAILTDETGYHGRLYLRIREEKDLFQSDVPFEIHFAHLVKKLGSADSRAGRHARALPPTPKLMWLTDGVALDVPKTDGRLQLWPLGDGAALRIRGGDQWLLPQPWPRNMRWKLRDAEGTIPFLTSDFDIAVFDQSNGRLYAAITPGAATAREIDGTDVVLVSRRPFEFGDVKAHNVGTEVFVAYARLGNRPESLVNSSGTIRLKARAKRRISVLGRNIARGAQGDLYGPETTLVIETGMGRPEERWVRFSAGGQRWESLICFGGDGTAVVSVREVFTDIELPKGTGPTIFRVELMAPSESRTVPEKSSGLSQSIYLWPEFSDSPDGMVFEAEAAASNFSQQDSRHISLDDAGNICLDRRGGFAFAVAGFQIENTIVKFQFPWPGVTVSRVRDDGTISHLPFGSRLVLGETDRFDTISISCPTDSASMSVMGRHEASPFYNGMKRNLSLRDLLAPASDNRVTLHNGTSDTLLFEIVSTLEPRGFVCRERDGQIVGNFTLPIPIDALRLEFDDIMGARLFAETALRFRPVDTRRPDWFRADLNGDAALEVSFTVDLERFPQELSLARLLVRTEGQDIWQPLRNGRGDIFAVPAYAIGTGLSLNPDTEELTRSFEILSCWLTECFALPCWPLIQTSILRAWNKLGNRLLDRPGGAGIVMRQANIPAPDDASRSWIPICHPLQINQSLYEVEAREFAWLSGSAEEETKALSSLAALQSARLRDASFLDGVAFVGFKNTAEAQTKGVPLRGFSPEKYYQFLAMPMFDIDPSAGYFWRGSPMLGPAHWRAAHLSLHDRLEETGLFDDGQDLEEGSNAERRLDLQRLLTAAAKIGPINPPTPKRTEDDDEANSLDVWINILMCNYARAARTGNVESYYQNFEALLGLSRNRILTTISLALRLAPELFAFHMLVWQLAKERP